MPPPGVITMMTGATTWHCFEPPDDDDDADLSLLLRHPNAATPAAVVDVAAAAARHATDSSANYNRQPQQQPVLLLLHANGFGAVTYAPFARALRARLAGTPLARAPILAPDFPGQGASSRAFPAALGRPLTAPRFAAWLLSALEAQGLLLPPGAEAQEVAGTEYADHQHQRTASAAAPRTRRRIFCFGHSGGAATALAAESLRPGLFAAIFAYEPVEAPPAVREAQARELLTGPVGNRGEPLARMARRRRAAFASAASARLSLGAKAPFKGLCPEALDLYVETQMEPVDGGEGRGGGLEGAGGAGGAGTRGGGGGGGGGAAAVAAAGAAAAAPPPPPRAVRLRCAPEVEAEYFQAFSRPPHDWRFERVRCPVALACGGAAGGGLGEAAGGGGGGGGGGSGGQRRQPQQQQQPQQQKQGPHDALAAWAPLTARALPRGEMTPPFQALGHLGPLEDPEAVGAAAAAFFARVAAAAAGESVGGAVAARSRL